MRRKKEQQEGKKKNKKRPLTAKRDKGTCADTYERNYNEQGSNREEAAMLPAR